MRPAHMISLAALALIACSPAPSGAQDARDQAGQPPLVIAQAQQVDRRVPGSRAEAQLSLAPVVRQVSPAVVNVYAQRVVRQRRSILEDMMRGLPPSAFGGMTRERIEQSLGSGVLVRADGVIVTNNHVVEGADALKVVLSDRREFEARVLVADSRTDLAVLKINAPGEQMPFLAFADTRQAQVGDFVIAIGNPFGLQQTVTSGIISALARTEVGINDFSFFIQTDAAINRGNSGGALVDMNGALVGVNTAIFSESGGSNGIGFAIPSEMVRRVVESALQGGQVVRPWLGVSAQPVTSQLARSLGLDRPRGVLVDDVWPGGPAQRAGVQRGDVILAVNGVDVNDDQALRYQAATQRPGVSIPLRIVRGSSQQTLNARVDAPPRTPAPDPRTISGANPLDGTRVVSLSPATAEEAGLSPFITGAYIDQIDRRGTAARLGFQPGDVIREVNGQPVRNSAELQRAMAAGPWTIALLRNGQPIQVQFGR
ncbi:MAG: DegQ family serine endoprotease [Hyphomonadaceae bacterium]|nr:DegQ family serine endoprotease [Hyphomonadaceae bacterium]